MVKSQRGQQISETTPDCPIDYSDTGDKWTDRSTRGVNNIKIPSTRNYRSYYIRLHFNGFKNTDFGLPNVLDFLFRISNIHT